MIKTLVAMLVMALAIAPSPAGADDQKAPSTAAWVEPWVGRWAGKVTWKGCSDDGAAALSLDVRLGSTGGLLSDGDAVLDGAGELAWVRRGKVLAVDGVEVDVTLTEAKKGVKLRVETAAGCVGKGTLTRQTSGIAACDSVRVLATIKAQCGSDTELIDVEASWASWSKLRGKKKAAQGKVCSKQRDHLRAEVASCEQSASSLGGGLPECNRYISEVEKFIRCDKVPQAARDATKQGLDAMKSAWSDVAGMPEEARRAAEDSCKQATDALHQGASAMGCPM